MKKYNKILEAVNRGIKFALDDFDDNNLIGQQSEIIKDEHYTKDYLTVLDYTVDMGLPSGTLWAKYNFGATCEPNNIKSWYGDYYAWGELEPNKPEGYKWETYKFYNKPENSDDIDITKYTIYDKLSKLQLEDDIIYQKLYIGKFKFHMPTVEQAKELIANTKSIFVTDVTNKPEYKDAKGYTGPGWFVISKINGNYLFFPFTGVKIKNNINSNCTAIWTSSVSPSLSSIETCAQSIQFNDEITDNCYRIFGIWKFKGLPIRPVINLN